jgi:hypothetical protein
MRGAKDRRYTGDTLVADQTDLQRLPFREHGQHRDEPALDEINRFNLVAGAMQSLPERQVHMRQALGDQGELNRRQRRQDSVFDCVLIYFDHLLTSTKAGAQNSQSADRQTGRPISLQCTRIAKVPSEKHGLPHAAATTPRCAA